MSIVNILGINNELNAILNSDNANVSDTEDISGVTITRTANLHLPTIPETGIFIFDISGTNHDVTNPDVTNIYNSLSSALEDGANISNNDTITVITLI